MSLAGTSFAGLDQEVLELVAEYGWSFGGHYRDKYTWFKEPHWYPEIITSEDEVVSGQPFVLQFLQISGYIHIHLCLKKF